MIVVKPSFELMGNIHGLAILCHLESSGRTCYKSETNITPISAAKFVEGLIKRGHLSVLEHVSISVRIICDRGVSHELVRHRLVSFSQESTRFCNYGKQEHITFIRPPWVLWREEEYDQEAVLQCMDPEDESNTTTPEQIWLWSCFKAERHYMELLKGGWSPQQARSVLPNSLKTEVVMTCNLREWRHVFSLRALGMAGKSHPQMMEIMVPMLQEFQRQIPVVFDDLKVKESVA